MEKVVEEMFRVLMQDWLREKLKTFDIQDEQDIVFYEKLKKLLD